MPSNLARTWVSTPTQSRTSVGSAWKFCAPGGSLPTPASTPSAGPEQQAIDWYLANTPVARGDVVNQVERFVVYPGQATAYTIGKMKFVELRERARAALGPRFDIRAFHDVVLTGGNLPLDILEETVDDWIAAQRRG